MLVHFDTSKMYCIIYRPEEEKLKTLLIVTKEVSVNVKTKNTFKFNYFPGFFFFFLFFFSIQVFFHEHSRITGLQGNGEGISFTTHYHFHPLHRHLEISRAITAESSPLHIASSRARTGNLWSPSTSR